MPHCILQVHNNNWSHGCRLQMLDISRTISRLRAYAASEHVAILAGDLRMHSGHKKFLLDGGRNM